ncbi:Ankdd1b [Phodopus roborovskii]|uniref:Ankdd1b protein n=1 Tax=Phodopus roborovskii TaxID=109678 RepID=A0AAU9Z5S4_PHORO|nr:Ankdd1b [Phodopus roborovskii]
MNPESSQGRGARALMLQAASGLRNDLQGSAPGPWRGLARMSKPERMDPETAAAGNECLLLIEKGFQSAAKSNDLALMEKLFDKVNINAVNNMNRTALHFAMSRNNLSAHGLAVIHREAWSGSFQIMLMLVKAGADQRAKSQEEMNVLHLAAQNNNLRVVDYLIQDCTCRTWISPMRSSSLRLSSLNVLDLYVNLHLRSKLKKGQYGEKGREEPDANTCLHWMNGETPFMLAVEGGHEGCSPVLLAGGSDVSILNKFSISAWHTAIGNGHTSLVNFLLGEYKLLQDLNAEARCFPVCIFFFFSFLHPKESPLHLAVINNHPIVVNSLLRAQADVDILDQRQQTPLHVAADLGHVELVDTLLKAASDLQIPDKERLPWLWLPGATTDSLAVDMLIKAERYYAWREIRKAISSQIRGSFGKPPFCNRKLFSTLTLKNQAVQSIYFLMPVSSIFFWEGEDKNNFYQMSPSFLKKISLREIHVNFYIYLLCLCTSHLNYLHIVCVYIHGYILNHMYIPFKLPIYYFYIFDHHYTSLNSEILREIKMHRAKVNAESVFSLLYSCCLMF